MAEFATSYVPLQAIANNFREGWGGGIASELQLASTIYDGIVHS
jgi:hypothetical protein